MSLEEFLARLCGVRRSGSGWVALCPGHADKNPSLSIDVRGGKILIHCHAGCSQEAVLAALGIEARGLFLDAGDSERRIVAEYPYVDESGNLQYQVVRYEPKSFRQRRPDGRGGWVWNLNGTRRVLYRLREVLQATSLIVCEGEKDCETARSLGLVATCNPGGAGKWRPEFSDFLRGKNVAIIADADEPGRKHALAIAESLFGKAMSLKVTELPGSKDLTDWIAGGGTCDVLLGWIEEVVPEWRAPAPVGRCSIIAAWEDIPDVFSLPCAGIEWLAEGLIPAGAITLVAGEPGSYKTWLALLLAKAVSTGTDFLGRRCSLRDVLYLDRENPLSVVRDRLAILGVEPSEHLKLWGGWLQTLPPDIGDPRLLQIARERKPLIICDSLIRFHSADENSATEMAPVMAGLRTLANAGATGVALHHRTKNETSRYRGSSDILGGVDVAFSLSRDREAGLLQLECFKSRFAEEFSLTLRSALEDSGTFEVTDSPRVSLEREQIERLNAAIVRAPGLSQRAAVEQSGLPQRRAEALLRRFEGVHWRVEPGPHNTKRYFRAGHGDPLF